MSSTDLALEAVHLGKLYAIGARPHDTMFSRVRSLLTGGFNTRPLWALRGVDFQVRRGENVGLIGPNGAGKTTLLMMLAGLLAPTEGSVAISGRVSPFFNIGSGLHSDLTVIDNLRLAGVLFGLSRRELRRRFDAIVDFGELEDYLYARLGELSVGYQARVPFAAALHSDVDILLADEVFTVGDARFQLKCLTRMKLLLGQGKTAVMASHSMDLLSSHCTRIVHLDRGTLRADGSPQEVIAGYQASGSPA